MVGLRGTHRMHGRSVAARSALLLIALWVAACGDTTKLPEAPPTGALTASTIDVRQTGNAPAQVDTSSVTFQLDDSGTLVMHVRVTSNAGQPVTVAARASLYDGNGALVGDAAGGTIDLEPGTATTLKLDGPAPNGTIASATVELSTQTSPTPTQATPAT